MKWVRVGFAVFVTIAFAVFATYLVLNADTKNQTEWQHWVYIFGSVEAIAFDEDERWLRVRRGSFELLCNFGSASVQVACAGERIAVYRGAGGAVHALEDRCAHRQVPLSMGVVEGDGLRCCYHGWARTGPQPRGLPSGPRRPSRAAV